MTSPFHLIKKPKRFGLFCVFVLLFLGLFAPFTPQVGAKPDFVTNTDDYILVENSYFIANISKRLHGSTRNFYIKPNDNVNIVALGQWAFLPYEEAIWVWNSTERTCTDGIPDSKESQTTRIVYQTSNVVVVESMTQFKQTSEYWRWKVVRYWTFYVDKPYFEFWLKRIYQEDCAKMYNYQSCYLFNDEWAEKLYFANETGFAEEAGPYGGWRVFKLSNLLRYNKYPWVMAYNSTYEQGFFTILISASHDVGLSTLTVAVGAYEEYQLEWSKAACVNGDEHWYTAVCGVAENSAYVSQLASSLYSSTIKQSFGDRKVVASANWTDNEKYGETVPVQLQHNGYCWTPYTAILLGSYATAYDRPISSVESTQPRFLWIPQYVNASGTYLTWGNDASLTCPEQIWEGNGEYTKVTWQYEKYGLQFKWIIELWNSSDSYYMTWYWKALETIKVTQLKALFTLANVPVSKATVAKISPSVVKVNASNAYMPDMYDEGFIIQSFTNTHTYIWSATEWNTNWYALKNSYDVEYKADTEWSVTLLCQHFRRYSNTNPSYFGLTNIHLPSEGYSEFALNDKFTWSKLIGLTDQDFTYRSDCHISASKYSSNKLSFLVSAPSGTTSTTRIYCGNNGKPSSVSGANYAPEDNYDEDAKILTLKIEHTSTQQVTVRWGEARPGPRSSFSTLILLLLGFAVLLLMFYIFFMRRRAPGCSLLATNALRAQTCTRT